MSLCVCVSAGRGFVFIWRWHWWCWSATSVYQPRLWGSLTIHTLIITSYSIHTISTWVSKLDCSIIRGRIQHLWKGVWIWQRRQGWAAMSSVCLKREGNREGLFPSPANYGIWGSVVSSPILGRFVCNFVWFYAFQNILKAAWKWEIPAVLYQLV